MTISEEEIRRLHDEYKEVQHKAFEWIKSTTAILVGELQAQGVDPPDFTRDPQRDPTQRLTKERVEYYVSMGNFILERRGFAFVQQHFKYEELYLVIHFRWKVYYYFVDKTQGTASPKDIRDSDGHRYFVKLVEKIFAAIGGWAWVFQRHTQDLVPIFNPRLEKIAARADEEPVLSEESTDPEQSGESSESDDSDSDEAGVALTTDISDFDDAASAESSEPDQK